MAFGLGERVVMAEDWRALDPSRTLRAAKGEAGTVRGFWPNPKGGDPMLYAIELDRGSGLTVQSFEIEPEP